MPILNIARQEAFAQALARGASPRAAYAEAGYCGNSHISDMMRDPKIIARVKELEERFAWGGSSDLAPVIDELGRGARKALDLATAPSMMAARALLSEAGRLKQQLAAAGADAEGSRRGRFAFEPPLTAAQWDALYAPKPDPDPEP